MPFVKAEKTQSRLRCVIHGPAGSGKTYTSLAIAKGIGGNIAFIDSERGRSLRYGDRYKFDVLHLSERTISAYTKAIEEATTGNYKILIIDSISHAWQELVSSVNKLAKKRYNNNTFRAWGDEEGTPEQMRFVDAMLMFPGHIIATMRVKTEWVIETNEKGKAVPKRIGLTPQQGKNIDYEFDYIFQISAEHTIQVLKADDDNFQDQSFEKPGEEFGKKLVEYLSTGAPLASEDQVNRMERLFMDADIPPEPILQRACARSLNQLTAEQADKAIEFLEKKVAEKATQEERPEQ